MQLKKTSKKIGNLINEVRTFLNGYFSFNNIDMTWERLFKKKKSIWHERAWCRQILNDHFGFIIKEIIGEDVTIS